MRSRQVVHFFTAGEALSAFFVGLLYFLAQWMWQMQNAKQWAGLPSAYTLFIAIAVAGSASWHVLMVNAAYPPLRMRIFNSLLFLPFAAIGVSTYPAVRVAAVRADANLGNQWWYFDAWAVYLLGVALGLVPFGISLLVSRRERSRPDDTLDTAVSSGVARR